MHLKANNVRARNAMIMLSIVTALEILSVCSDFLQYDLLQGEFIDQAVAEANDSRQQILAIIFLIAMIISVVTFIMWFRRAYHNIAQVTGPTEYKNGWAAGGWFIPYKIVSEIFRKTDGHSFTEIVLIRSYPKQPSISGGHFG